MDEARHPHPGRPTHSQSEELTQHVLATAWALLVEQGPDSFSIDRLPPVAKVSKSTIYSRWPGGKRELLEAVLADRHDQLLPAFSVIGVQDEAEAAFADLAMRTLNIIIMPEGRALDRLIDWLDATGTVGGPAPVRTRIVTASVQLIEVQMIAAAERWHLPLGEPTLFARFWLEAIIGHARTSPDPAADHCRWAGDLARSLLRALR